MLPRMDLKQLSETAGSDTHVAATEMRVMSLCLKIVETIENHQAPKRFRENGQ